MHLVTLGMIRYFIGHQIRPWANRFNPLPRELPLNCTQRLACASGRGWGTISEKGVTCPCHPRASLPCSSSIALSYGFPVTAQNVFQKP